MRFDFAISFAGPDRQIARALAEALTARNLRVFFDEYFEHEMLGVDGADYLNDVFFRQSRFCIALVSANYQQRAWSQLERRAAQARELETQPGFVLPVLLEDHRPDWLLPTRIHFNLSHRGLPALIELLLRKLTAEDFGPYSVTSTLSKPFTHGPIALSAVCDTEFAVWSTYSGGAAEPVYLLMRDGSDQTWSLRGLNFSSNACFLYAMRDVAVEVADRGDEPLRIRDLTTGRVVEATVPRRAQWQMVTDCKYSPDGLLLGYCGSDTWYFDLKTATFEQLTPDLGNVHYAHCDFAGDGVALVSLPERLELRSLKDHRLLASTSIASEIMAVSAAREAGRVFVGTARRLLTLSLPDLRVAHEHRPSTMPVSRLASGHAVPVAVCVEGIPLMPSVLEVFDGTSGLLLARREGDEDDPWNAVAIGPSGQTVVLSTRERIFVLERGGR
jgi:hypothetical protein